jgi:hypothetical protein
MVTNKFFKDYHLLMTGISNDNLISIKDFIELTDTIFYET